MLRGLTLLLLCGFAGFADAANVDLIVQFRQPDIATESERITANAFATRRAALEQRLTSFRRDLSRLDRAVRTQEASTPSEPVIRRTYHRVLFGASIRVRPELRASLQTLPYVASVHDDVRYQAMWTASATHINAPQVWSQFGTRGAGIKVAVIDSGVDYHHPALGGGIGAGFKVIGGWDFVDDDADPTDTFGHGTHVAGIIAGNAGEVIGVAPEASLYAYRALDGAGRGGASDVIAAIERSVDPDQNDNPSDHVDVVNLSLGGPPQDNDPGVAAVESAAAFGIVFCIAAGNGGDYGNVSTPGISPSAITVGASDLTDALAAFSSRGPSMFFAIKPEVIAPGVSIYSSTLGNENAFLSGTSMATPHVAGLAALMRSVHPDWSPSEIKNAIITTAKPFDLDVMTIGAGRVDALSAVQTDTLIAPSTVSFGAVNATIPVWNAGSSVTLRNRSAQQRTFTSNVRGLRDGVTVTVTPPAVTLEAGATATVQIDLSVTNALVPAPVEGSLSYGGRIEWAGGAVPVHVPWAFIKGSILAVDVVDAVSQGRIEVIGAKKRRSFGMFGGTNRVLWPLEKIDLVVTETARVSSLLPERIVALEQVDTTTTARVTARMSDARNRIIITTGVVDEHGAPLIKDTRACKEQFVFRLSSGRKFTREQAPSAPSWFGSFSGDVRLYTSVHCFDPATHVLYTALLDEKDGLSENYLPALRVPWVRHDLEFEGNTDQYALLLYPSLRLPGAEGSYFFAGGVGFLTRPTPRQLTVYSSDGSSDAELVTSVARDPFGVLCNTGSTEPVYPCRYDTAFLYFSQDDVRVDGDLYREVSPMAYRAPVGSPLTFAAGPYWGQMVFIDHPLNFLVFANWFAPLNEKRSFYDPYPSISLRNEAGLSVGIQSSDGFLANPGGLAPGAYRADAVNAQYSIAGIPGASTLSAFFDTRRADRALPQFTGLRIENAQGRQTAILGRQSNGRLVFSVTDVVLQGGVERRVAPLESATRVEYSVHGADQWQPLDATVTARQYDGTTTIRQGVGTVYVADLSAATGAHGLIDLRVHAEDAAGNAIEILLAPALIVRSDEPRKRAARH